MPALVLRIALATLALTFAACAGDPEPDAFGNFEAIETVVSAQSGGQLLSFTPAEGARLAAGAIVAQIDTSQAALERQQVQAQQQGTVARSAEVAQQADVLEVQRVIAQRTLARTRRLYAARAATAQQLDQAERDHRVLVAQIAAVQAQRQSAGRDVAAAEARVAQIRDRISKSQVVNPEAGTVLATYARAGEVVQPGAPLYRIAALDTLALRAYIDATQLAGVRLGQRVRVNIDDGSTRSGLEGIVTWVSPKAEFTPTPVQTRDERADLVYAIKVRVPNRNGLLKIGMPADVSFGTEVVR